MIQDLDQIVTTVLPSDPSFRAVGRKDIEHHILDARQQARSGQKDEFLLSLMRLLALPGNGHTRLIPNDAILVHPLRFVTIGTAVRLLDAAPEFCDALGGELISVNDVLVADIEHACQKFLAGTPQRKRVIGPILFAWPGALRRLGVSSVGETIRYQLRDKAGQVRELRFKGSAVVPGAAYYPRNEHGKSQANWGPKAYFEAKDLGQSGLILSLPSFFDPEEAVFPSAMSEAAAFVRMHAETPLVIDLRGNTGGNFLLTLPVIDALSSGGDTRPVAVVVDKFTFSAAIVFVALLKHRLGTRLRIVGEEMGDGLTFFAEGGTHDLSATGATVRYSTAFHDWAGGRIDQTTPAVIAEQIVPVGSLQLDRSWAAVSDDVDARERFCRDVLAGLIG